MKLDTLILQALVAAVAAAPASKLVVHESRDAASVGFTKGAALHGDARVPVRIALKQRNLDNAMNLLMKV